jgi:hypothetical protein
MKRLGQLTQVTHFAARLDVIHSLSRAEVSSRSEKGEQWEGLKDNVALLGFSSRQERPKMIFAATAR